MAGIRIRVSGSVISQLFEWKRTDENCYWLNIQSVFLVTVVKIEQARLKKYVWARNHGANYHIISRINWSISKFGTPSEGSIGSFYTTPPFPRFHAPLISDPYFGKAWSLSALNEKPRCTCLQQKHSTLGRLEMLWLQLVTIVFNWVYNTSCVIWPSSQWKKIWGWESPNMYSWCWRASLLGRGPKWRKLVPSQVSSVPPCAVLYTKPYKKWRRPWTGGVGKILRMQVGSTPRWWVSKQKKCSTLLRKKPSKFSN